MTKFVNLKQPINHNIYMKRLFILSTLIFVAASAYAQDIIYLKDGSTVKAKISEINDGDVKYKRFDNPEGPTYTISRDRAEKVVFENGVEEILASENAPAQKSGEYSKASWYNPAKWTARYPVGLSPYVDLGGIMFMGPHVGAGIRWRQIQLDGFFKAATPGLLNNEYFCWDSMKVSEEDSRRARTTNYSGGGGGITLKVLFPVGDNGLTFHAGVLNEWCYTELHNDGWASKRSRYEEQIRHEDTVASGLGGGVSWRSGNGLYFQAGIYLGLIVADESTDIRYDDSDWRFNWDNDNWNYFYGTVELTIGYDIPLLKNR